MKLRFILDDGAYRVGDVITPEMYGVAQLYLQRGVCEEVRDEPPEPSPAFARPNKAVKPERVKTK